MGGMQGVMGLMPGMGKMSKQMDEAGLDDRMLRRQIALIDSMTKRERRNPDLLQASRKRRIAAGAGLEVQELNRLLKMHRQMADVMKKMGGMGAKGLMRGGLGALFGRGGGDASGRCGGPATRCRPAPGPPGGAALPGARRLPPGPRAGFGDARNDRRRSSTERAGAARPDGWRTSRPSPPSSPRTRSAYEDGPLSRAAAWKEFATAAGAWVLQRLRLALDRRDARPARYLGEVGLYHPAHFPEPEIGWMLVAEAEGRGIAREAALALRAWAYGAARLGRPLVSYIDRGNARSIRLAERLGAWLDPGAATPASPASSSTATPARRRRHDRSPRAATERLTLRPAPAAATGSRCAAFFESEAARYVGGPLDRAAQLARLRRRRRLLGAAAASATGRSTRPRPAPSSARSASASPPHFPEPEIGWIIFPAAPAPRLCHRGGAGGPRPTPSARSAGPPRSATSTAGTPPRSRSPASSAASRTRGAAASTRRTSSTATPPPEARR